MATIAAAAIVAGGAAYGAYASGKSAKKQQQMIEEQIAEARRIRAENRGISESGFADINSLIDQLESISAFLPEGERIADSQRQDRLDFILGDTYSNLKKSQDINTRLAAYDFGSSETRDILRGLAYDTATITRDMPVGAFANLSVKNAMALSQQGLSNTIGIGDYLSRLSGIDVYNPYSIASDLYGIEQGKVNSKIQARNNLTNQLTENNTQWFNQYKDLTTASMAVESNKTNAQISAVNSIAGAVGGAVGSIPTQNSVNAQTNYFNTLSAKYGYKG